MKINIPNDLIPKLERQLETLAERGGEEWERTALGIFRGILVQETRGRDTSKSVAKDARKTRKKFKSAFRRV